MRNMLNGGEVQMNSSSFLEIDQNIDETDDEDQYDTNTMLNKARLRDIKQKQLKKFAKMFLGVSAFIFFIQAISLIMIHGNGTSIQALHELEVRKRNSLDEASAAEKGEVGGAELDLSDYQYAESFFNVFYNDNLEPSIFFELPEELLNGNDVVNDYTHNKPMFVIDVMYASGSYENGERLSIKHMPALETDYNMFEFAWAPDLSGIDFKKPLLSLRGEDNKTDEASWTGWLTTLTFVAENFNTTSNETSYLVDASKLIVERFYVIDDPFYLDEPNRISSVRIVSVKGYEKNLEFRIQLQQGFGTEAYSTDLTFSIALLPAKPMKARLANDHIGYFTTSFIQLEQSKGINLHTQANSKAFDRKTSIINRRRLVIDPSTVGRSDDGESVEVLEPLVYYIDPSVPPIWRKYLKKGVENWNKAFEAAGFSNAIRAVLPEDEDFPCDYDAGDIRYNSISWSVSLESVFAIGPATVDPRSGEILNSDIVFSSSWIRYWLSQIDHKSAPIFPVNGKAKTGYTMKPGRALRGGGCTFHRHASDNLDHSASLLSMWLHLSSAGLTHADADRELEQVECADEQAIAGTAREYIVGAGIVDVVTHEVGHTLGLRHNFKGSMAIPFEKLNDRSYIEANGLTSSVMDYIPTNLLSKKATEAMLDDAGKQKLASGELTLEQLLELRGQLFTPTVGAYDIEAIRYGYSLPLYSEITACSTKDEYIEYAFDSLKRIALSAPVFATDEDGCSADGMDPSGTIYDLSADPLRYYEDRLVLVTELRSELYKRRIDKNNQQFDYFTKFEKLLLNQVLDAGLHLVKFLGGVSISKTINDDYQTLEMGAVRDALKLTAPVDVGSQRRALQNVLALLRVSTFFDTAVTFDGVYPNLDSSFEYNLHRVGWCEGISEYCYGSEFIDITKYTFIIQAALIDAVLSVDRLNRMFASKSFAKAEGLGAREMLLTISNRLFGETLIKKEQLHKKDTINSLFDEKKVDVFSVGDSLGNSNLWSIQRYWVQQLVGLVDAQGLRHEVLSAALSVCFNIHVTLDAYLQEFKKNITNVYGTQITRFAPEVGHIVHINKIIKAAFEE